MTANAGGEAVSKREERRIENRREPGNNMVRRDRRSSAAPVGATPTDAGLREALEKIAEDDETFSSLGEHEELICEICGDPWEHDADESNCPIWIARAALSQGGGE